LATDLRIAGCGAGAGWLLRRGGLGDDLVPGVTEVPALLLGAAVEVVEPVASRWRDSLRRGLTGVGRLGIRRIGCRRSGGVLGYGAEVGTSQQADGKRRSEFR
jgi:hypothetical protein